MNYYTLINMNHLVEYTLSSIISIDGFIDQTKETQFVFLVNLRQTSIG